MRRVTQKSDVKMSGDKLGVEYAKLVSDDFPTERFESFGTIYEEISVPLHGAKDDTKQFEKSKKDILDHFDQLRLIPLKRHGTTDP